MAQIINIDARLNDTQARQQLNDIDRRIADLRRASTGIKITFDNNGEVAKTVERIVDGFGRVSTVTTRWRDEVSDAGEVIGRVAETTKTIDYNLERQVKQWDELERKVQGLLNVERQAAEAAERQAEATRQRVQAQQEALRLAQKEAEVMAAFNQNFHPYSSATSTRLNQDDRTYLYDQLAGFSRTSVYTQDYINRSLGITRDLDSSRISARDAAAVFEYAEAERQAAEAAREAAQAEREAEEAARAEAEAAQQAARVEAEFTARNQELANVLNAVEGALSRLANIALRKLRQAFREAFNEMKDVDSALIVVRKVTDFTNEQLESTRERAYDVGKEYGVAASEYLDSVAEMARAGYKDQSADLAELAVKLQLVGDVSQKTANQFLIATDKAYGFKGNVEELSNVIDQLNEIDNNFATSIQKMADGMGIIAPIASQAHVSITELEAALGTITATTQRSGAESARALRALFLNIMGDTKTEIEEGATWTAGEIQGLRDVLNLFAKDAVDAAAAAGEVVNPMKAIESLAKSYKEGILTEAKLMEMVSDIGGKLRASQLMALISNWDMYVDMLEKTEEAAGSADREVTRALDAWDKKVNILKNTWTDFIQQTINSRMVKNFLDFATNAIEAFGNLGNVIAILAVAQIPRLVTSFATMGTLLNDVGRWAERLGGGFRGYAAALTNVNRLTDAASNGFAAEARAIQGVNVAASTASVVMGILAVAISGTIIAINAYKKSLDDTISAGKEAQSEIKAISSLASQYDDLKTRMENGESVTEKFKDARQSLIDKLKDEGVWVDSVIGKYETLEERISAATDAALANRKVQLEDSLRAARDKILFEQGMWSGHGTLAADAATALGLAPNWRSSTTGTRKSYSPEEIVKLYDQANARRTQLSAEGFGGSAEDKALKRFIDAYSDAVESYREAYNQLYGISESAGTPFGSNLKDEVDKQSLAFAGLTDEVNSAVEALEKYKAVSQTGEHGDAYKEYADVYAKGKELYEKGLYGSRQYQAALEALLPESVKRELAYDWKELGKYLYGELTGGTYEAMYGKGGEDFGKNFATYLRDNWKEGMEDIYEVVNYGDGTFELLIHDEEALAKAFNTTTDQIYTFLDAVGIYHSDMMMSTNDVAKLVERYGDLSSGIITDVDGMISQFVKDGRTQGEIKNIISQLEKAGKIDMSSLPEDLDETIEKLQDVEKAEDEIPKSAVIEVLTNPDKNYFENVVEEIDELSGKKIIIKYGYQLDSGVPALTSPAHSGSGGKIPARWTGTTSATAGETLVNEKGAEIIVKKGEAFIANDGKPAIVNLKEGDMVFNAKETKDILNSSNRLNKIKSLDEGGTITTGRITPNDISSISVSKSKNTSSGGSGKRKKKGSSTDPDDLLSMLSEYMDELLDKAKDALDAQIKAIDAEIERLKAEHDAQEEANELEELRLKILEAEKNLVDANVERTVRYFNKATGQWEWMADQKAVAQAQKALEDAQQNYYDKLAEMEYQAKLDELKNQKDALNDNYDVLSDTWKDIKDEISKALNKKDILSLATVLSKLGLTAAKGSVAGVNTLISDIGYFTDSLGTDSLLSASVADRIMSPQSGSSATALASTLSSLLGITTGDLAAKGESLISTISKTSSTVGDTYYINGVRIGNDMLDRPLSEVLSVLPIYAG